MEESSAKCVVVVVLKKLKRNARSVVASPRFKCTLRKCAKDLLNGQACISSVVVFSRESC